MPKHQIDLSNESLADADSRFITVNGIKVHYKEKGSGESALIFLHGFAASLFSWQSVFEPLSKWGRVVAYDRPAFGLTERPLHSHWQDQNPYGTEEQVEMLKGLMDALGIRQAVLFAHSAGGTIGMAFTLKYRSLVKALVLVGPAVYLYSPVPSWGRQFLARKPIRIFGQVLIHPSRKFVRRILRSNVYHDASLVTDEVVAGYEKPFHAVNWEAGLWEFSLAVHARNLWKRADELKMPVLVVAGDDDRVIPTRHSRRLAEITPGAKFVEVPHCGHVPQEERPDLFLGAVDRFLSRI
jgi:pimeloyl-ACP methyl ester carboxylesterase